MTDSQTTSAGNTAGNTPEPFNNNALAAWLGDIAGTSGPVELTRIGAGQSNLTYLAQDTTGRRVVVRRPPLGLLTASAHDVAREGRIMSALEGTDVPVPTIYGTYTPDLEQQPSAGASGNDSTDQHAHTHTVADVPVVAMSAVDGITINSKKAALGVDTNVRRAISDGLIDAMVAIHAVDLEATGLSGLASHEPYAPRQLRRWAGQWEKTKTRELPALEELTKKLHDNLPEQTETVLVHGDLHIGNVIVDASTGAINAVVDWELTTLGDPLSDIGSLLAYWPVEGGLALPGFEAPLEDGFPSPGELAQRYISATGRSEQALAYWHVLGLWKVAIIVEGVVRRIMNNPSNRNLSGAPTQEMVEWIVNQAAFTAKGYGL